jgi:hypothetical protein
MEAELHKAYYDLKNSHVAYTSTAKLIERFKGKYAARNIREWAKNQENISLHKPARKRFARNFMLCHGPFSWLYADLADFSALKTQNDGMVFALCVIDCLTKKSFVEMLKTKNSTEVAQKLEIIIKKINAPIKYIATDFGNEFLGACKQLYKKYNINHVILKSSIYKAAPVERYIQTFRAIIYRYLTEKNTHKYIDVLQNIVSNINSHIHRSIKMTPNQAVSSKHFQKIAFLNMFSKKLNQKWHTPKYKVGDIVRISYHKSLFTKAAAQTFSTEIFRISKVYEKRIPMYQLETFDKKLPLEGLFYEKELTTGQESEFYKIESIIKTKLIRGRKFALVRYKGYNKDSDAWVPYEDIKDLV